MQKNEFLARLRKELSGLPQEDVEERLNFYSEMIDDRMEDGLTEEEAVLAVGDAGEIAEQIVAETPFTKIAKERIKANRSLRTGEIILLTLGSPIWLSLVLAAGAVVLSLYLSLWAVIISLWSVVASLAACFIGFMAGGVIFIAKGNLASGLAVIGAGLVCAGLAIFAFFGCKAATKGILHFTKKIAVWTKNCFIKKEAAQ